MATEQAVPSPVPRGGRLLRVLGLGFGLAVTMGGTIGIGILRTPGSVAAELGTPGLVLGVWLLGGLYALFGTFAVAELGTSVPKAGGWYVYAERAFGRYAGFTVGWVNWIAFCGTLASLVISVGEFAGLLFPALAGFAQAIGVATLVAFMLLHWRGVGSGSSFQKVMASLTAVAFVVLVAACFALGGGGGETAAPPVSPPATVGALLVAVVLALQGVLFTYDGWYGAIYFTEEVRDPGRQLPRAMIGGILAIVAIYLLVNLALLYVLPLAELAASPLAAADAARRVFGSGSGQVITALSFISVLSVTNATLLENTRILYGLSRDGLFFRRVAVVNHGGTPTAALLLTTLVASLLVVSGTFNQLIALTSFLFVLMHGAGFAALFVLRRREPALPRPYRAWGYPWTTGAVIVLCAAFLVGVLISDTRNSFYGLGLLAASYPLYRLAQRTAAPL